MDVRQMDDFQTGSFDAVVDKGRLFYLITTLILVDDWLNGSVSEALVDVV